MEQPNLIGSLFIRTRGSRCILASVAEPFIIMQWPDISSLATELALPTIAAEDLHNEKCRIAFLSALARRVPEVRQVIAARGASNNGSEAFRVREKFYSSLSRVTVLGDCSSSTILSTLQLLRNRVSKGGAVEVVIKYRDLFRDWSAATTMLQDISHCISQDLGCRHGVTVYGIPEAANDVWSLVYSMPMVRLAWIASDGIDSLLGDNDEIGNAHASGLRAVERLSNLGVWPHIVLPVTSANTHCLPDVLIGIITATRAASIDILPLQFLCGSLDKELTPPALEDYIESLVNVYHDYRLPLRRIAPHSWILRRIGPAGRLPTPPRVLGTELVATPEGTLYPAECVVGAPEWCLGSAFDEPREVAWEICDLLQELLAASAMPEKCRCCDWRNRCGGVDARTTLIAMQRFHCAAGDWSPMHDLFCKPRLALFEEAIWDTADAARQQAVIGGRERLQLRPNDIVYGTERVTEPEV